jgi:hypothetical protein
MKNWRAPGEQLSRRPLLHEIPQSLVTALPERWCGNQGVCEFHPFLRSTIGENRSERAGALVERRADQECVTLLCGCQFEREDLAAVGIDRRMELPPAPTRLQKDWACGGEYRHG